jgi:hypothetical protein
MLERTLEGVEGLLEAGLSDVVLPYAHDRISMTALPQWSALLSLLRAHAKLGHTPTALDLHRRVLTHVASFAGLPFVSR